jgi:hypothetical protein
LRKIRFEKQEKTAQPESLATLEFLYPTGAFAVQPSGFRWQGNTLKRGLQTPEKVANDSGSQRCAQGIVDKAEPQSYLFRMKTAISLPGKEHERTQSND